MPPDPLQTPFLKVSAASSEGQARARRDSPLRSVSDRVLRGRGGGLLMAEHLPFASASTKAEPSALMQQPGLNLILGRGEGGDMDFARDGQASAVVQVGLCLKSEAAASRERDWVG